MKQPPPFKRSRVKWGDVPVTLAVPSGTPKLSGIKQPFTGLTGSVGREFRQTTVGVACLCPMVSQLEGSKYGDWDDLKVCSLASLMAGAGSRLGASVPLSGLLHVDPPCGLVWAPSQHGGSFQRQASREILVDTVSPP